MGVIIMGGEFRGRKLVTDSGSKIIRPTSGKVREALFSSLGEGIVGTTFVDLFAGSGAVGLEAASRGASEVYLVENHPKSWSMIKSNLKNDFDNVTPVHMDAMAYCKKMKSESKQFDYIFADPPFTDDYSKLKNAVMEILSDTGTAIIQYPTRNPPIWLTGNDRIKRYGESCLVYFSPAF